MRRPGQAFDLIDTWHETSLDVFLGILGMGNATPQLVAAVDAAEAQRGFSPPIFVDIRYRRSGRALGFRESAFEELLGWRRYRWMPTLGNSSIATGKGMQIACPVAASQLLELARDAAERSARVIFFCACESPWRSDCHRHEVARLVQRSARRRGLPVQVQEWPGGRPTSRRSALHVSPETLRALARGAKSVPLSGAVSCCVRIAAVGHAGDPKPGDMNFRCRLARQHSDRVSGCSPDSKMKIKNRPKSFKPYDVTPSG